MEKQKVTAEIDKEKYLKLRTRLLMQGLSYREWLEDKVDEELKLIPQIHPKLQEKINELRDSSSFGEAENFSESNFNPVPKLGKGVKKK